MEGKVNKVDNSRRRSSLRNPIDMKIEPKHKNLQFLDSIQEDNETEKENTNVSKRLSNTDKFKEKRRESLKNEFKIAKELLKQKESDIDDEETDEPIDVKKNTEKNKHIPDEDDDDSN